MPDSKIKRILIPIEGKPVDKESLDLACLLTKKERAEIWLIYVIEVRRNLPIDAELTEEIERGEKALEEIQQYAAKVGCKVQTDLLQAREAGAAIVSEAVERGAELIVMGVSYQEQFGEYCVEPRAQYVLEHAACRVILAREPLREPVTRGSRA